MTFNMGFNFNMFFNNSIGCCNPFMSCGFNSFSPSNLFNFGSNMGFQQPYSFTQPPSIFGFGGLNNNFSNNLTAPQFNFGSVNDYFKDPQLTQFKTSLYDSVMNTDFSSYFNYQSQDTPTVRQASKKSDFNNSGKLGKDFLNKTKEIAKNIGCDYEDLLAVMNSESGVNPKAQYKNKSGKVSAVGLIQFTQIAIDDLNKNHNLNLTLDSIYNMSGEEQLDLVQKFYKTVKSRYLPNKSQLSSGDLYALTYLPARANKNILASTGDNYYHANKGLDLNKDGKITKGDLAQRVESKKVNLSMFA